MLLKQKLKTWPQLLMLSLLISFAPTASVLAAGDATFSISPSSGGYTVGGTFSVSIYETSSAADNTEGADVNLSYNSSLLQYTGLTTGAFPICPSPSGGGGSVGVACASGSPLSGTQTVATISFKVLASGTASVNMVSGGSTATDIQNSNYQSVWSGNLPSASFSLTNPATSSGSTKTSSGTSGTKASTTPTTSTSTSPKPTTPTTTTKPTTNTQTQSKTTPIPMSYLTLIVTDRTGQPIKGAKVVMDNGNAVYTDSQGKAVLATETPGSHAVTITDPGKQPYYTKISFTAGQSIPIELQLTSAKSSSWLYIAIGVAGILILIGVGLWYFKPEWLRLLKGHKPAATFTSPTAVVGGNTPSPAVNPVASAVPHSSNAPSLNANSRPNRSFYLRRRDSFDGIRGRH